MDNSFLENIKKVQGQPEDQKKIFSEESRIAVTKSFLDSLNKEKEYVATNDFSSVRGIVRDSTIEANKNLIIFNRALWDLMENPLIPEKERMLIKIFQNDLSPVGARETLQGVDSYKHAVKSIIGILDTLLTKEASLAIHAYAEKIFVAPGEDYKKHGPEPFDGTLFKPGE